MPLAAQALLPFFALLVAAAIVRWRPRRNVNGWIASGATGIAGIIALVELLRLAPGEHVDVPYLTTFPYADLAVRLDGLSLAFAADTRLLLAAASAIHSVGTSAFSGVPSDTFGLATFLLVLLPVAVRVGALAWVSSGPQAAVTFEPAIAWVAPAGYLLLRLLALMG